MLLKSKSLAPRELTPQQRAALEAPDQFLLTVVTINLNNALNLRRTLKSLEKLRNDLDIECIFIDGGSTDNSVQIARGFYLPQNLISEFDTGIYNAMNKGLYRSRGKYLLWLNSGDELLCEINSLKNLLSEIDNDLTVIIACSAHIFYEKNPELNHVHTPCKADLPDGTIPHQAAFFNRSKLKIYGGYDEDYKVIGDRDLILRIFNSDPNQIIFSDLIVARWYYGGITATGSYSNEIFRLSFKNKNMGLIKYSWTIIRRKIYRMFQVTKDFLC